MSYKVAQFAGSMDSEASEAISAYLEHHHPMLKTFEIQSREAKGHDTGSLTAGWNQGQNVRLHHGVVKTGYTALISGGGQ